MDVAEVVDRLVGCGDFEIGVVLDNRLEDVTSISMLKDLDDLVDNLKICLVLAFEEVSELIEAIPVLNEGFMLVHWPEGGEETEATERAVSITVRGDDTLLTGLEKLGNEILVLLEEGTTTSCSVLDTVWVVSKLKDCDEVDLILEDGEKLLDCLWLVEDVELSVLTEVILTSTDVTLFLMSHENKGFIFKTEKPVSRKTREKVRFFLNL